MARLPEAVWKQQMNAGRIKEGRGGMKGSKADVTDEERERVEHERKTSCRVSWWMPKPRQI